MSLREGTRRKKISVLHMLGTWEGKIDGCNCPSCKEYDEEQVAANTSKTPSKISSKNSKGAKGSPQKTVIKVKTTKLVVDVGTGDVIAGKLQNKKEVVSKDKVHTSSALVKDFGNAEVCDSKSEVKSERKQVLKPSGQDIQNLQTFCDETSDGDDALEDIARKNDGEEKTQHQSNHQTHGSNEAQKVVIVSSDLKPQKGKQNSLHPVEIVQVKEEPDDFFSDDEFEGAESDYFFEESQKTDNRGKKRARMVTSEMENIYAKPRMVFTGTGVVKKFEPGLDKTPKSRRGRKPSKNTSPVKVKQEPREERLEETDLDQLQKAFTEAAESLDVGDEFLDALGGEFDDEEPKEGRVKKKPKLKVLKRVDSNGDKYEECSMCFKMLKESSMKQHFKTHSGEKPHTCDECDARFTRKGDVERHKRLVHKNQKPFKCRKCNRNFSDRKNLKLHLQNHDKPIYYSCLTCGFKFGKREYYENHIHYIHPLPDGSTMPVFEDFEQDPAMEQLQELENEEKKEILEKEGKGKSESILTVKSEIETAESDMEEDPTEITVTEGAEEHPKLSKCEIKASSENLANDRESDLERREKKPLENGTDNMNSDKSFPVNRQPEGTDIRVSKGTLSFTRTVSDTGSHDEDLVNRVIAEAISQATNTLESLQSLAGSNMARGDLDFDDDEDEDDDEDDMLEEDEFQDMLGSDDYSILPVVEEKPAEPPSEIHVSASVGGQKKKFIFQVQSGSNLNVQSPEGMELIVNMVNQLCGGKAELDGPIEVVMQYPGTKAEF